MKNSRFLFLNVLQLTIAATLITCLSTADATEMPQTKPGVAKVLSVPQKNPSPVIQSAVQGRTPPTAKGVQSKPTASSTLPLPYNTLQRETFPESQSSSRIPLYGLNPAETATGESTDNTSRGGSAQKVEKNELNAAAPSVTDGNSVETENSGAAQIFLVLAALCTALAGTAVILYLISKRAPQKEETKVISPEIKQEVQPEVSVSLPPEEKPVEQVDVYVNEEPVEEDAAVELAQRYQRGQGEMQLLFSIQARENEKTPLANLIHTSSSPKAMGNTRKLAKKFGLGKSEAELLMRLHKCGTSSNHLQRML